MRTFLVACVVMLSLLTGCGWINPHTTVTGGSAAGSIDRTRMGRMKVTPVSAKESNLSQSGAPVKPALPAKPHGFWKTVIKEGN